MGIRVHRVMGWGLIDVKVDDYTIVDPRFNSKGMMFEQDDDPFTFEAFKLYATDRFTEEKAVPIGQRNPDLFLLNAAMNGPTPWFTATEFRHLIAHDTEGMANVVCFVPPSSAKSWFRWDDTIDYYMESYFRDMITNDSHVISHGYDWCRILNAAPYPYFGFMDIETGEPVKQEIARVIQTYTTIESDEDKQQIKTNILDLLGCKSHWSEKYAPNIPGELIEFLKFGKIFNDPSTIRQLRPMIYTYWC